MKKKLVIAGSIACLLLLVGIVGCAPRAAETKNALPDSGKEKQQSIEFIWSEGSDCSKCHKYEEETLSTIPCAASETKSLTCSTCHADQLALGSTHQEATPDKAQKVNKLKRSKLNEEACKTCHGSQEELVTKTSLSSILTDEQGTKVNPHALPLGSGHDKTSCGSCHSMHEGKAVAETATDYCSSCHHANVYECYTCHA